MTVKTTSSTSLRSFLTAAWLGWQIESNWTDPFLFAVYALIKPLASVMILVVMYAIITQSDFSNLLFSYMYIGNAFYIYVGRILNGIAWAVIDDREHYKTLKYVYTAPVNYPIYLLGRGAASFLAGSIAVLVTLVMGVLFLDVQINLLTVDWPLFILSLVIGVIMMAMLGLMLAGLMMTLAHHVYSMGEAVAGALYLFTGAIFPLEVLPAWLRWVGYIFPVTYWLELMRRALVGQVASAFPTLAGLSDLQILGILSGLTVFSGVVAFGAFRRFENSAREKGLLDMVTNY
jgi:ABC-2 type transport system permease protein